jgi:basic amino acid/polyamine antiporter, APA family
MPNQKYTLQTATAIIIANMIGTGVFAALFFQVDSLPSGSAILILWLAGGIVALSGGLCYAELTGLFPRSGGEYEYLTKMYHPALGFSTGVCTLIVGFAAPMAGSALNLGNYFAPIIGLELDSQGTKWIGVASIVVVTLVQLFGVRVGSLFQNISTAFKLVLIGIFISLPLLLPHHTPSNVSFTLNAQTTGQVFSGSFFSCLALLYFSYTGWNSSVYISSDIEHPQRNLPLSILVGIVVVTAIYLLLNFTFLHVCSMEEIKLGGSSVGNTVVHKLFGERSFGGIRVLDWFSALMSFALLATLNGYIITASRVAEVMGKDYPMFKALSRTWPNGSPYLAAVVMGGITVLFTLLSDFKSLLDFVGFSLAIFASLSVFGIYIMRWKHPDWPRPFKAWGYPVTPLIFLAINLAMIYYSVVVLYDGNFWYGYNAEGHITISPLSASVIVILLGIVPYFFQKSKARHAD